MMIISPVFLCNYNRYIEEKVVDKIYNKKDAINAPLILVLNNSIGNVAYLKQLHYLTCLSYKVYEQPDHY